MSEVVYFNSDGTASSVTGDAAVTQKNMADLRAMRNHLLIETDWTQSRDVTLTNDAAWQTYRQSLRDITDSATSLDDVTWPTKPE